MPSTPALAQRVSALEEAIVGSIGGRRGIATQLEDLQRDLDEERGLTQRICDNQATMLRKMEAFEQAVAEINANDQRMRSIVYRGAMLMGGAVIGGNLLDGTTLVNLMALLKGVAN